MCHFLPLTLLSQANPTPLLSHTLILFVGTKTHSNAQSLTPSSGPPKLTSSTPPDSLSRTDLGVLDPTTLPERNAESEAPTAEIDASGYDGVLVHLFIDLISTLLLL